MLDTTTLDKRFQKFFQDGKLVQVHVSKWGMSYQLSESDLGLDKKAEEATQDKKLPEFMQLGKKWLFTNEVRLKFGRIESQARRYLQDHSQRFPICDAHFVRLKWMPTVLTNLYKFKADYDKAVDEFCNNYDKHKEEMFTKYPDHRKLLEPYYPPVDKVRPKFGFTVSAFEVAFPKQVKEVSMEDLLAQNLAVEQAVKKYEGQMKEMYEHSIKQMDSFVKEAALAARGEVVKIFETIAAKIQNKEIVTATNLKTLRSTIESFDALDFLDDAKVRDHLNTVKKLVNSGADFKEDGESLERLKTAVAATLETAKNMSDIDTLTGGYIRRLDIGDDL